MKSYILSGLILLALNAISQKKSATNWYFGEYAGVSFSASPPSILLNSAMNVLEGSATISDTAGNLLFYSNGITVWDRFHTVMPNGSGLLGGPSTSQNIIIPKPNSNSSYYLFYADNEGGPNGLRYSEIDMQLNGGAGDVVTASKNTLLLSTASEKMTAINHCNGRDVWLMAINFASDEFYAYLITPSGIMAPVKSPGLQSDGNCCQCMKFSPDGKWLAYTNVYGSLGIGDDAKLFTFSNQTGLTSHVLTFPRLTACYENHWGVSFSPGSTKLYISSEYNQCLPVSTRLLQYDLLASNIINSRTEVLQQSFPGTGVITHPFAHIQNAPNGKIYIARWSQGPGIDTLAVINAPDASGLACNAVLAGLNLSGRMSRIGLPNFNESNFYTGTLTPVPSLSITGNFSICAGSSTTLSASGAGSYTWNGTMTGPIQVVSPSVTSAYTLEANTQPNSCIVTETLMVYVANCTGINNDQQTFNDRLTLFPNPVTGLFTISSSGDILENFKSYVITNDLGQLIGGANVSGNSFSVSSSDLLPGIYFIHIKTLFNSLTLKFVKTD